jgi:hypothetical protein
MEQLMEQVVEPLIHQPAATTVGLAMAELILAVQKELPQVRLVPCEPIEGEDIHLKAYLPIRLEERLAVQHRITEIALAIQDKHDVYVVVVALPETNS